VDLVAHKVWQATTPPSPDQLTKIHILIVHALESGGASMTKSNLFLGSRIYFSGGSVATFSLFGVDGAVECAGYSYDYSGYIREKSFEKELRAAKPSTAVLETEFPCQ
jgi:hypothetical protein